MFYNVNNCVSKNKKNDFTKLANRLVQEKENKKVNKIEK
jgi:hypothetical protein